jgi:hypothetical protein
MEESERPARLHFAPGRFTIQTKFVMEITFWILSGVMIYAYIGHGILFSLIVKIRSRRK